MNYVPRADKSPEKTNLNPFFFLNILHTANQFNYSIITKPGTSTIFEARN
jgi:hypothetical protein